MKQRSPHLLPGQSDARRAQLLAESPFESLRDEVARGGVFSADKLAALFLVLGLFFSQLGVVGTPAAEAATSVFQEGHGGYRAGLDTEIDETLPDLPGGDKSEASEIRVDSITSGNQQGLIKFGSIFDNDGGPIPIGSTINSATLEINVSSDANPATVVSINRLLGNWPETATWSSTGDGIQLDDVDAVSVVDDVWNPGEVAGPGWRTFDVTTSLAIWAGGAANHGWVITTNDESNGLQFYSSEHTNPVERPRLTIDYTAPEPNVVDEHSNVEAQSVEPAPEAETLEQPETALAELQTPTPEPTVSIERETVPVEEILLGLPVSFEQNVGQAADQSVDIVARGSAYAVSLADGDAIVVVGEDGAGYVFRMNVLGRANQPALVTHGEQAGSVNYLIGDDPDQWLTDVSTFDAVEYRDVYPGVDLRYYGNLQQLQYDFIVQPGADPSSIALGFDGATSLSVDDTGGLVVGLDGSRHVTFSAPVTYQNIGGTRQPVKSAYLLTGDTVQFEVGTFDPTEPLIIDPTLVYSTEVGGTQIDRAADVAVDASGNAYITGHTQMSSFPTTVGPHGTPGSFAIMVTKLSADGSSIVYSTYVGGSGPDAGDAIEVDGSGNAYVSGDTNSSNFPTANGFDTSHTGSYDAVLFKLDSTGANLLYSTFWGGNGGWDQGYDLALDTANNVVLAGSVDSGTNVTITGGVVDSSYGGGSEAYVAKFDTTQSGNSSLLWSTYLGGSGEDEAFGVDVDSFNNVYVVGSTMSSNFPVSGGAYAGSNSGDNDWFIAKLNPTATSLAYSTYLGGDGADKAYAVQEHAGLIYATGYTNSSGSTFPTTAGAYQTARSASWDAVVAVLDPAQSGAGSVEYSSLYGGNALERGNDLSVDSNGTVIIAGYTGSSDLSTSGDAYDASFGSPADAYLAAFYPNGAGSADLAYATYLGGSTGAAGDGASGLALDTSDDIYVAGDTDASDFPQTTGPHGPGGGGDDAFVTKFTAVAAYVPPSTVTVNSTGDSNDNNAGDGTCDTGGTVGSDPECTLRAAMQEADASGVVDTIHFDIPATDGNHSGGVWTISPGSLLPLPLTSMTIDASTQTGWAGDPIVAIDGSSPGAGADAFYIDAGNTEIRGFVIHSFSDDGIVLESAGGNTIVGNWIGLLPDGSTPAGLGDDAIVVSGSAGNTIGGPLDADRNVIASNGGDGILVTADGTTIENNYIGTDSAGALDRGNGVSGIEINGAANTDVVDNLVSGNTDYGIDIRGAGSTLNTVSGNRIGTNAAGTGDLGNGSDGVVIRGGGSSNTVGGTNPGDRNIISGNDNDGVWITDSGTQLNTVLGNWIGVASDGSPLGNSYHGVAIEFGAADNLVGGTTTEAANRIENNAWDGVAIGGSGTGNAAVGNSITSNAGLGIDHDNDGVTPNGAGDPLDYPVITSASETGGTVTVDFTFAAPDGTYRIEFFGNTAADPSGNGEGEAWAGSVDVTVTGGVPSPASTMFAGSAGDIITATATEGTSAPFGATSEFSAAVTVLGGAPNNPPTAIIIGGPYSIVEGEQLDLDGSGSSDPDTDPLTYRWDVDNDGQYDDATGVTPSVPWLTLQGLGFIDDGGPHTIGLEVDDGTDTDTASTTFTITNAPPTVTVAGTGSATAGSPYTVNLAVTDPGDDTVTAWRIDWGDGSFSNIGGNPATANHPYTTPGYHEIRAAVTDEDGTFNATTVIVPQYDGDDVLEISPLTGNVVRTFADAALNAPVDAAVASDGYLYVVGNLSENVVRFDVGTGSFESNFIPAGTGGLAGPGWLTFPSEAELWVSTFGTDSIKAFARSDGSYIDEVVAAGVGGLAAPAEMTIGPDGDLYVTSWSTDVVHRYDAETGLFVELFVSTNLTQPTDLAFGPDGKLYVTDFADGVVRRFNGTTGAYEADVVSLFEAYGITFGPDGLMYVTSQGLHQFNVYDLSGTLLGQLSNSGDGLSGPSSFDFVPSHYVTVAPADSDGDGLWDHEEDGDTDGDNDPSTNAGPNTDGDANPNYLDADDDDDGTPTASENADPNSDGDPRDAFDTDRDGQPDYLDTPTTNSDGTVATAQKISETAGGFGGGLTTTDHFGRSVASIGDLDGDGIADVAVGAPFDDDGGSDKGAVYVLFLNLDGTVRAQQKISEGNGGFSATLGATDQFGIGVAGIGDLDGDGINDIAVGAHQDDEGGGNNGAAYVLFLNTNGTVKSHQKINEIHGGLGVLFDANDRFGGSVAGIGDLDGDGINDIAVGSKDDDDGGVDQGAVYVLFLNADGTVKSYQKLAEGVGGFTGPLDTSDAFGFGVAALGDIDGDDLGDIAVGAYWDDDGSTNRGAVYVLRLNADGTVKAEQKVSDTAGNFLGILDNNDEFGTSVAGVGDVDADGTPDLVVGAPKDDDGASLSGAAYVLFLNADGTVKGFQKISAAEGWPASPLATSDQFGFGVTGVGDLDGDGTIGIVVGAYGDDDGGPSDRGAVYVLNLAAPNFPPTAVPGGPYFTDEGEDLILDGSGSSDPDTDPLTYNWDIDNDGQYDDAAGPNPTVAWLALVGLGFDDDGGPYPIGLEVDDGNGHTDTATVNWTIANTPPTISVTGSGSVITGSIYTVNLSVSDPGADTVTEWTINWGDGNIDSLAGNPASATHTYANPGEFNITAAVSDEDSLANLPWHNDRLVVPGLFANEQTFRLEATSGVVVDNLATGSGQGWAIAAIIGPDGLAYVGDYTGDSIRRYNPVTGVDLGVWVPTGTGGLDGPAGMQFGPDGHLYVSSNFGDEILEFDTDSTFLGVFASGGGLDEPDDLVFGPDGHLYVSSFNTDQVLKYDGYTGASLGVFASGAEMGQPSELTFDSAGRLYVASVANDHIARYNTDGSFDTVFASAGATGLDEPRGAAFGPDGHLYVGGQNRIVRYDGSSGALIDVYLPSGSITGPSQSAFLPAHQVTASAFVVNSTGDSPDNNVGDGVCDTGGTNSEAATECTLRAVIAEATVTGNRVEFDMPATEPGHSGGVWTIAPNLELPQITSSITIDGRTQPGWTSTPVVEVNGAGAGAGSDGFRVAANNVEIRGLAINRFLADGIEVAAGAANTMIAQNHIGLDAAGLVDRGNTGRGIDLGAGSGPTAVGGPDPTDRNIISGNGNDGIIIWSSNANTILNNFIGTNVTGNAAIPNDADGIALGGTSASNVIGQVGDINIISGNANDGVENDATGANNVIYYNLIGIGADGTSPVPNGRHGVVIYDGANNTWVYQNLISGNTTSGVVIDGNANAATNANNIIGNYIGIDLASNPRPNGSHGVHIFGGATGNVIGGTPAAYHNVISGNSVDGIRIDGSATSGNRIENNYIGTNIAGDAAAANGNNGVFIVGAPSNTIGGTTVNHRNVISGNGNNGVLLDAATATGNTIQGNYVGLNAAGDAAVPNADEGVDLSDAPGNQVGGNTVGARNVISGNGQDGVLLIGAGTTGNFVSGNYVGTNAAGDAAVANGRAGVYVDNAAANNDIGGPTADWGNVISGNAEDGIYLTDSGTDLNRITRNYIGTNAAGDAAIPNGDRGVQVESGASFNRIGDIGQGNVISGNTGDGIIIADWLSLGTSDNNIIENLIGVAADGTTPLGNGANGVHLDPVADTLIGTNTIAHNAWDGVLLEPASLTGNSIVGNSIHSNGQLGIDLGNDGVSGNDVGDSDGGPNNLLNYPEITSAVAGGGNISVDFTLDVPAGDYRIEFFDNSAADPSGNGEGEAFVDYYDVVAHPGGSAGYSTSIPGAAYDIVTATATEQVAAPYGSTSEFAAAFAASTGTMTVNSTGDGADTVVGDGLCDTGGLNSAGDPECTLRAAIEEANFDAGADDIEFDIPVTDPNHSAGIWTLAPGSQYDNLDTTMSIDAATQPGWAGDPVIEIDGSGDLTSSAGLNVFSSNSEIRGLILHSFPDEGIEADGSFGGGDGNTFAGNWVGIDASGAAAPNGGFGILLTDGAANNTVGGTTAADANVVGSNPAGGVGLWKLGTDDNRVYGNYVGVLSDGVTPVPNSGHGIDIDDQAAGNEIGGTSAQANIIRSNTGHGIYLSPSAGSGNSILRNVIAANSGLGINLDDPADPASGVTPNDVGDGDSGPNDLLNYPVIDSAVIAPPWITVNYTVDAPSGDYVVEFFSNPSGVDGSGFGEGEAFEYRDPISHPGGSQSYVAVFSGFITDELTATLTEDLGSSFGSTSEFSAVAPVSAGTLVVNSTGNAVDAAPGNATCDTGGLNSAGDPECTLNAAIQEANAVGGPTAIHFAIPDSDTGYQNLGAGASYWKIRPAASLAALTANDTTIDATTQTSYAVGQGFFVNNLGPEIELDGSLAAGIGLDIQSSNNEIRGFVINRFATGIRLTGGDANTVAGNYIGTDVDGVTGSVGNTDEGILIDQSADNVIGGPGGGDRNIISGNRQRGITIDDWSDGVTVTSGGTQIINTYIGVDRTGLTTVSFDGVDDQQIGIYLLNTADTTIGTAATGNLISGNSWYAIYVWGPDSANNVIQNNVMGLDRTLTNPIPNGYEGSTRGAIFLSNAPGTLIGGTNPGEGNVIASNGFYGVVMLGASAVDNAVVGNSIYANGDLGIDLDLDGVTPNDVGDTLPGSNDLRNYPEITSATENAGTVTVDFDLDVPAGDYRIEFFVNTAADPSGNGEGEAFVDFYNVIGHPGGSASYSTTFPGSAGDILTATTTEGTAAPFGSTSEFSAAVTVTPLDTTPPVITLVGANPQTIEVGSPYVELGATAWDDVDGDITGSIVIDATAVNTALLGSYSVTYNVSDSAGNPAIEVIRTVDVVDTTAPVLTLLGANPQTIEVGSPYVELGATATDNYDGDLTGSIIIDASAVNTALVGSYVVTYDVVDSSGNPASGFRTVDVVDTTAPVITLLGANPQTIEAGSPYVELGATAFDNYDGDITGSIVIDASGVDTSTVGSYSVTYDVTDSQGNPAVQVVRTVDVVDTTAPVITLVGANPQTIEVGSPYVELGATAWDAGDGDLTGSIVIDASAVNTAVVGTYSVTYDVTDSQGNPAVQVVRTVDVVDTTLPVITLLGANPQTIEVGSPYVELGATAFDNYDGDITGSIAIDASAVNTAVVGSYTVTYDVTDSNGNAAIQVTRTVDVVDTTAPIITLLGANPQVIEVGSPYVELGATAFDNYDGDITGSIVIDASAVNTAVVGSYPVTYDVTDSQGNPATQAVRTVDVVDTTAPVITLLGANPQVIEVGSPYVELGATAFDNYDGDITGSIVIDASAVNTAVLGSYSVTYNVTDSNGNPAVQVTRIVDVVDTTAPVITLLGANPQTIEVGSPYVELGATAFDNYDGDITGSIVIDASAVNTAVVGSYVVSYSVVDSSGNPAFGFRTVDVVDTTAPVITLLGANPQVIEVGSPYVELGATAFDNYDGDITGSIVIDASAVNTAVVGSYPVTYDVTDSNGNPAIQVVRTVDVVDTTRPVITLLGANPQTIDVMSPYVELGATAFDNYDGDITGSIVIDATAVNTAVVGSYPVTYDVTDSNGNPAIQVVRTVDVINVAPTLGFISNQTAPEMTLITFTATATDPDPTDGLTFSLSGAPGGAGIDPVSGDFTWTPSEAQGPNTYIFNVVVTDSGAPPLADSQTITITVTEANRQPTLNPIPPQTVDELTVTSFVATAGDPDVPANGLTFILNGAPAGATINPSTGVFTWIPSEAQGPGVYTFDVVVSDDGTPTLSATQPVTVTVNEVNTAPTVIDPGAQADAEADSVSLFIAASDSDIPVNTLAFSASGLPDGLSINPVTGEISGTIDYTANAGSPFNVTVTVTDDGTPPRSGQATFVWDVADTNRGPLPLDDVVVATEDTPLTIDVLANDTDPDGDPLTISGASDPANGSVTLLGGSVIYTPDPDFYGPDSFIYTVTDGRGEFASASVDINVSAVNDPPDLNALTELNVNEGSLAIFSTSATDVEGNSVTFSVSGAPAGAAIDPVTGTFRWIPDESQGPGSYVFDVVGTDDGAPPAVGSRQVRINVAEVNAAPIVANPGTQSTAENQAVSLFISATDPDIPAGTLRYSATGLPPGLAIDPVSGEIAGLIPFDAAAGSPYTVTVTATDDGAPQRSGSAVFSWSIGNTNRPPTAFDITVFAEAGVPVTLILSGSDPDGDPLYYSIDSGPLQGALAGGPRLYDYTALITAGGSDSFTFIVSDGSLQATGNVSITIIPNLPPVGEPDEYDVRRAGVVVVESPGVLDNDGDPEGRQITAVLETPPSHGTVKLQPDGSFFYEHTDVLVDSDAFTYRVDDGMQLSEEITVQLNIEENLPPVAIADSLTIDEDTAVVFRPLENDFDPNNEPILVSDILWREGFLSWSLDGTFRYAPPPDWNGTATIVYEITDGELIALGIVTIVVQPVNDPPTAVDARLTGDSGQVLQIDLRPYASDVDGDPLSFLLESPRHAQVREVGPGRFELDLDGVITDLPPLAFVASDPSGATDTSLLMVTVRIPAELVGVPALVTDDIGRNGGDVGESFDPPGSPPLVTGLRLMIGSIFDTFRAFRVPMLALLLVLLGSLWMGLSRRFAFSSTPTLLPLGSRRKVDIVMAPSSAGVPARREPGSHQSVVHRFGADETGIIATGARSMLRSEVWVEVETPEGDAWVNGEYLTEQQQASFFRDDARVRQLVTQLVERIYRGDDLLPATAGHDLHVALYGPPVRFAAGALPRLLAGESVYWWWGPEGDTPRNQGTFAETVGESFTSAFRNRDAHVVTPTLPIPVEFVNMHSLVVGHHDMGEGWRVFIRYEQDEPSIAGLMREAHANPAAMHGRMEFQGV